MADIDISGSATSGSTASGTGSATDETSRTDPIVNPTPGDITPGAHGSGTDDGSVDDEGDRTVDHSKDTSDTGGTPGASPVTPSYTPVPEPDQGTLRTRTVYMDEYITDFSAEKLAEYEAAGAIAIAVYDDGTETQVAWSSVTDPTPPAVQVEMDVAAIAQASNQHFWHDTNGAHVTEVTQDDWNDSTSSDYQSGHNLLMNSLGILLRKALNTLVSISNTAVAFFDGNGNDDSNVVARFGGSGAQIGKSNAAHSVIDANGQRFYGGSDGTTQLANIGYGEGASQSGTSTRPYYTFGTRASGSTVGNYSVAEGVDTTASGYISHAGGIDTVASGNTSHAEGVESTASGYCSHAQNFNTVAAYEYQTVIGKYNADLSSPMTHITTFTMGNFNVSSILPCAVSVVSVKCDGTVQTDGYQVNTVYYNGGRQDKRVQIWAGGYFPSGSTVEIEWTTGSKYAFAIGNGTSDTNRSNAYAIDWDGYSYHAGEKAYPLYIRTSFTESSSTSDLPLLPCFVYCPANNGLFYCD